MIDNALQDSEEKYRLLFDGSNDGIVLHDIDGRILDVNKKIQHYFNETNSQHAKEILENWDRDKFLFWQIIPKEMVNKYEEPVLVETTKTA